MIARLRYALAALCFPGHIAKAESPVVPIVISEETTILTEPLADDGLPDYNAYLLAKWCKGLTRENNAAIPLVQALWPHGISEEEQQSVLNFLGVRGAPPKSERLESLYIGPMHAKLSEWLRLEKGNADPIVSVVGRAQVAPWTARHAPPLAQWLKKNAKPFDLLIQASKRERCFATFGKMLSQERSDLTEHTGLALQMGRESIEALRIRAMHSLGEGRPMESWGDLQAAFRLAKVCYSGDTILERLLAPSMTSKALESVPAVLHHGNLSLEQAKGILRDLQDLPPLPPAWQVFEEDEHLFALNSCMLFASKQGEDLKQAYEIMLGIQFDTDIDWNIPLHELNKACGLLKEIFQTPDREHREHRFESLKKDYQTRVETNNATKRPRRKVSLAERSRINAELIASSFVEASESLIRIANRQAMMRTLTQTAAALAIYRSTHGTYPKNLHALTPDMLSQVPLDMFTGKPLSYRLKPDGGYLLYSVGENGEDNGGDSQFGTIKNGEWMPAEFSDYDQEHYDLVVRVPVRGLR